MSVHSEVNPSHDARHEPDGLEVEAGRVRARRRQILDAATEVFAAKGFARATIREIARKAGVADGTIYNYFRTKTDLLFGLLDQLNETEARPASFDALAAVLSSDSTPSSGDGKEMRLRGMLEAMIRHRLEHVGARMPLLKALLPELLVDEKLRARYREDVLTPTIGMAEAAFAALVSAGALRPHDPSISVRLVAGMVMGTLILGALDDPLDAKRQEALPNALVELLLDGLGARAASPESGGTGDGP